MNSILGTPKEWKELGFRSGLEIHQQLDTKHKLFCRCPVRPYTDEWHAELLRHMRPTLSELGEYDGTALMEFKTHKEIIYRLNRETVCTYEMDDNPPFPINEEAVDKALTIALAFKCKIVGELHVIRKQYLDGSIPAGFQRTTIVGVDGKLPLSSGKEINIIQIGLEEDACREVSDIGHRIIFYTDRLSIPLIEVVTEPTIYTPEEVADATWRIGQLLRATGFIRRGIGAVRQDVNLSIEGGTRVEIKGVPRIPRIPYLLAYEGRRQKALLEIAARLQEAGFKPGDRPGESILFKGSKELFHSNYLKAALMASDKIRIVRLPKARGLMNYDLTQGHTFADEFSGRIRVVACIDQTPNFVHTDGESGFLDEHDRKIIAGIAGCSAEDIALAVWGDERDSETAAEEILDRYAQAILGIPNETRQALRDNTTDFERVLPGPDRMYPDTDSPPYRITEDQIERARQHLPEPPWEREERYEKLGIPEDVRSRLAIDRFANLFDEVIADRQVNPLRTGEVLIRYRTAVRRKGSDVEAITPDQWKELLTMAGNGTLKREVIYQAMVQLAEDPTVSVQTIIEKNQWTPISEAEKDKIIQKAWIDSGNLKLFAEINRPVLAMESAMNKLAGRASGRDVWQAIQAVREHGKVPPLSSQ